MVYAVPQDRRDDAQPADEPLDFDALFERYAPYVARIGWRILGRDDDVDDLIQDVFANAHTKLDQLRDPAAARAWLATSAVRRARRTLRRQRWRGLFRPLEPRDYDTIADPRATPADRTVLAGVYRALDHVAPDDRIAWVLRHVEGHELTEVAALCECSLATVKRRIKRAHDSLRQRLGYGEDGGRG